MADRDEFTPEVLENIIHAALKAGDIEGVGHALRIMAVRDPHRAQQLIDTMKLGIVLAELTNGGTRDPARD